MKSTLKLPFDPQNNFVNWALSPFFGWVKQDLERLNDSLSSSGL